MDNLEKNLSNLPKPKLRPAADLKIRLRIYRFMIWKGMRNSMSALLHPHSLMLRVSYTTLAIVIFLGGSAVYAANNDNITPGHSLYPLKKTIETVEQNLSLTKNAQVNTLNKLSERRLKEAINLANEDVESDDNSDKAQGDIKQNLDELVENLNEAVIISQEIDDQAKAQRVKESIKEKNENVIKYLEDLGDIARQKRDHEISDKVDEAKQAIEKYQKMLEDDEKSSDKKEDSKKSRWEKRSDDSDDNDESSQNNQKSERDNSSEGDQDSDDDSDEDSGRD